MSPWLVRRSVDMFVTLYVYIGRSDFSWSHLQFVDPLVRSLVGPTVGSLVAQFLCPSVPLSLHWSLVSFVGPWFGTGSVLGFIVPLVGWSLGWCDHFLALLIPWTGHWLVSYVLVVLLVHWSVSPSIGLSVRWSVHWSICVAVHLLVSWFRFQSVPYFVFWSALRSIFCQSVEVLLSCSLRQSFCPSFSQSIN